MYESMNTAYNWSREISPERLRKIENLKRTWRDLFNEDADRGHYARIQWCGWANKGSRDRYFQTMVNEKLVWVHVSVLTAREWFAREAYNRALAATRERYPDFEAHHFTDGDRIGERRICFESETNALSASFLYHQLWHVITKEGLEVSETWFSGASKGYGGSAANQTIMFTVVRDVDEINAELLEQIESEIRKNGIPTVSDDKLKFSWNDIGDDFMEMSDPELVALNWADARPVPTPADLALERAVSGLDIEGIRKALADGASPNLAGYNRFCLLFDAWNDHLVFYDDPENFSFYTGPRTEQKISVSEVREMLKVLIDAGAHPNCYDSEEGPALVDAVIAQEPELVRFLLDCGADPTISLWDIGMGPPPTAWDFAMTDGFTLNERDARECYYEMVKKHPAPYGNRASEEQDRHDAELPDHLRHRSKNS